MNDFLQLIQLLGDAGLSTFWFPVALWTVFGIIVGAVLRFSPNLKSLYHYHIRSALMAALPIGVFVSYLSSLAQTWIPPNTAIGTKIIVIEAPAVIVSASPGLLISGPDWTSPALWSGIGLLLTISIGLVLLLRIYLDFNRLYSILRPGKFTSLSTLDELSGGNRSLLHSLEKKPGLVFSTLTSVPFTLGFRNPVIVLPEDLKKNPGKLNMSIRHELMHIKRHDYALNVLLVLIKSFFWFHPLVHKLYNDLKEYREISCDDEVLTDRSISKKGYAELLFELAPRSVPENSATISMAVDQSTLGKRISQLKRLNPSSLSIGRSILISMAPLLLITGIVACSELQSPNSDENIDAGVNSGEVVNRNSDIDLDPSPEKPFFVVVEKMPELIGGLRSVQQRADYPEKARKAGVEGRVIVQFIVNEKGYVENPRVIRGIGSGCDEEALRVVREARFRPGKQRGQPVRVQYSLPIVFKLANSDTIQNEGDGTAYFESPKVIGKPIGLASLESPEPGVITGFVRDSSTQSPLQGANVVLPDAGVGASTNDDGSFRLTGIPGGDQTVRISYVGFKTILTTVNVESSI